MLPHSKKEEKNMARSEAQIHSTELLLTLDCLLHESDEDNPIKAVDICRYGASKYGLKYNGGVKGDEIKRQRISACLRFLDDLSKNKKVELPFTLKCSGKKKYYIEQKNGLSSDKVASILAAIKNDRYTKDEDVDSLIESVLDAFGTNSNSKEIIKKQFRLLIRGCSKFDKETMRKYNLIDKAYRDNKMIKVSPIDVNNNTVNYIWHRVYFIKEVNKEPYAFLIPVSQYSNAKANKDNYIFAPIANIAIPKGTYSDVISDEFVANRDLNKLFLKQNPHLAERYVSLDEFLENEKLPLGGKRSIVTFHFELSSLGVIKKSFEDFFSEDFVYQKSHLSSRAYETIKQDDEFFASFSIYSVSDNKECKYGLVNFPVNLNAFKVWLLTNPYKEGKTTIADMISVIKPNRINYDLAKYYFEKYEKHLNLLPKDDFFDILDNGFKDDEE